MPHDDPGPLARLRRSHEQLILTLLRTHGPLSRGDLGRLSGLSRTTLYDIVGALVDSGALVAAAPAPAERRRGRPVETLSLHPGAGQAIGIDFARRAVHVAAVNLAHEVIGSASERHAADLGWEARVDLAERLVGRLGGGTLRLGALSGIGVGVVGPVGGPREHAPADHALLLRKRFGVPVLIDNNTRLAALAESTWGAASGVPDVLYLRLSHGVGGGMVVGGALHRGAHGLSGEIGHITAEPGGRPCSCGNSGCLETVASIGAVLDAYAAASAPGDVADVAAGSAGITTAPTSDGDRHTRNDIRGDGPDLASFLAALPHDPAAARVLDDVGTRVGAVLAAVCNAVDPQVTVIGGELAQAGPALLDPVARALADRLMPYSRSRGGLRAAALGEAAGALGAIALVLHESPLLAAYPPPHSVE
ncbi:ROK family protein [Streptomyces seoulensis]